MYFRLIVLNIKLTMTV